MKKRNEITKKDQESGKSSFETGIFRKLEKNYELLEWLMGEYIVSINSKWSSNDFTSSNLAKMLLKFLEKGKTNFSVFHRLVKEVLKKWEIQAMCQFITTTKYAHSRKTKMIYRFDDSGIQKLKQKIMDYTMKFLEKQDELFLHVVKQRETMKSREKIIDLILVDMENQLLNLDLEDEDDEDF